MISFQDNCKDITSDMLKGFFVGWKECPDSNKLFSILNNSDYRFVAIDDGSRRVVGFINAISDGVLSAYIPLLEVLPEYQGRGIGSQLVKLMLDKLKDHYMIDIVCDESIQKFYEKFGLKKYSAMILRNYDKQRGITK